MVVASPRALQERLPAEPHEVVVSVRAPGSRPAPRGCHGSEEVLQLWRGLGAPQLVQQIVTGLPQAHAVADPAQLLGVEALEGCRVGRVEAE
eukprot:9025127-Prorocentrum_lima.AAC.1